MSTPRLRYAVIDSGPLIKGLRLETLNAEVLVTVPEVLSELRDEPRQHCHIGRHRLQQHRVASRSAVPQS